MKLLGTASLALLAAASCYAGGRSVEESPARPAAVSEARVPLKEAKLNIEHNATDRDTGFQGAIDGEGWRNLDVRGPRGRVLSFRGRGALGRLGLTELFFETVEPENKDTSIRKTLRKLPEGRYRIAGTAQENGKRVGRTAGAAWLTHDIPAGPRLVSPAEAATVPTRGVVADWACVEDDHRQARKDHRLPVDHREGRRAAPSHDREVRAQHVPATLGDPH
jgi:hypothetical protein